MVYEHKYKHIGFNGGAQPPTSNVIEVFGSKENFLEVNKLRIVGLANLDGVMNFCTYFKRDEGNIGIYEREEKSHPVNGEWDRYYILANYTQEHDKFLKGAWYENLLNFQGFLKENGWFNDSYFSLMERYI